MIIHIVLEEETEVQRGSVFDSRSPWPSCRSRGSHPEGPDDEASDETSGWKQFIISVISLGGKALPGSHCPHDGSEVGRGIFGFCVSEPLPPKGEQSV